MSLQQNDNFFDSMLDAQREERGAYPYGRNYDNLFNSEHRDMMIEKYGSTSASFIAIEELTLRN